jgi:signal transduction histidine kinase/DNA-binding response OmpR family regulator
MVAHGASVLSKANILLVDDRSENLLALRAILSPLDVNIVEARSGREALKRVLEREFAVILLDVMMPDMDGFETARLIRQRDKSRSVPIIFVTAMLTGEEHAFQGYEAGAVDYLMKPFIPEVLCSKVSVFVELFKKTEQVRRQEELIRSKDRQAYERRLADARHRMDTEAQKIRSEQQITKAVVEHAPIAIARLDTGLNICEANPTFCQCFDLDMNANNGMYITDALPWLPESILKAAQGGQPCRVDEITVSLAAFRGEAKEKYWDIATWPIKSPEDVVISTVIVATDVTERVLLEQQRKDFVGTLAHDLQTPVIASDRALGLLLDQLTGHFGPDLLKLVTMLRKNNQNLLHMIQSLLDIYHYEVGARALYFDQVDLKSLVVTCVGELTPLAEEQGVSMRCNFDSKPENVFADRTGLRRVITNLLDNSIKFTGKGGVIEVRVHRDGDEVFLEVQDNGIGISEKDQAHLFERFWHGTGVAKAHKGSSGLGLYLCRQIVEAHGGRIECHSQPEKTTIFVVSLPAKTATAIEDQPASAQELKSPIV